MRRYRIREDESSTGTSVATIVIGALAGFAVGMFVAQRFGGLNGIASRFKKATAGTGEHANQFDFSGGSLNEIEDEAEELEAAALADEEGEDEDFNGMDDSGDTVSDTPLIEERVLEAFNNDPILAERAIDIGAMGDSVIELAGWVDNDEEAEHAMTVARGVPGVETVVNRLLVDEEEHLVSENVRRFKEGDPAVTGGHWEGQQVGTGKRRQGRSDEIDRHADPKPHLEDRWLGKSEAVKNAADDVSL
jgi:osmotically-inducible protein OsmY